MARRRTHSSMICPRTSGAGRLDRGSSLGSFGYLLHGHGPRIGTPLMHQNRYAQKSRRTNCVACAYLCLSASSFSTSASIGIFEVNTADTCDYVNPPRAVADLKDDSLGREVGFRDLG